MGSFTIRATIEVNADSEAGAKKLVEDVLDGANFAYELEAMRVGGDGYVPHQPSLDRGISPEMDRLNWERIQLINRKYAGGLTPEEEAELKRMQDKLFTYLETVFPRRDPLADVLARFRHGPAGYSNFTEDSR
jgi:hypothetical protein